MEGPWKLLHLLVSRDDLSLTEAAANENEGVAENRTFQAQRERPVKRKARSCRMDGKRLKLPDGADAPWAGQSVTPEVAATLLRLLDDQPDWGRCQPSSGCEIPGQRRMLSIV